MDGDKLFVNVGFVLASQCHDPDDIKNILIDGGAKHINYLSEHVTHVIADSNCLEAEEAVELYDKPVVSSLWVHLSLKAHKLLPTEAFSPTRRYFNNVMAYLSKDLSQTDTEILAATLTFYGGTITKNIDSATHFIALSTSPSDQPADKPNLKTVAPDWILDSVKHRAICDELSYEPGLLLGPPPPTPPPPKEPEPPEQPEAPRPDVSELVDDKQGPSSLNSPSKQTNAISNSNLAPSSLQPQSTQIQKQQPQPSLGHQQSQYQQQRPHAAPPMQPSQIPRPRIPSQNARGVSQPRFGSILPGQTANMPNQQRPIRQPIRVMAPEHQQAAKPAYNQSYRKVSPYQNNIDHHQQPQLQQQQPPPSTPQHLQQQIPPQQMPQSYPNQHVPMQQAGNMMNQPPSRIPPPGSVYHHPRAPYPPNNHIPPRVGAPQPGPMMAQGSQPMMSQPQQMPSHMINRFQDANSQIPPRPYQVCGQPPQVNLNYQQGNMPRQQMYYAQNPNQNQVMRMPQSGPMLRHPVHSEQMIHENPVYNQSQQQPHQHPPSHEPMQNIQHQQQPQQHQHYQVRQPHLGYPQQHPQQQQQQQHHQQMTPQPPIPHQYQPPPQQQHSPQLQNPPQAQPVISPTRPPFHQPTMAPIGPGLRPPRNIHEPRNAGPRSAHPSIGGPQVRGHRAPMSQPQIQAQQQPHPSIFDHKLESSLTQMRAKVPTLTDNIEYFGYKPKEIVPKNKPLTACKFRLIEYTDIDPKLVESWCDIIKQAGGTFFENLDDITHLICETRLTDTYSEALRKGIRCITIYWVNDVLHLSRMSYPWKPLHIPLPYDKNVKPLLHEMISVTNFKGKERNAIREMIKKTGARFTEYFTDMNTLLICANAKGEKYDKALQWKIPIVNYSFLSDILLERDKDVSVMLDQSKYTTINNDSGLGIDSYASIRDVMAPWMKPLIVEVAIEPPTSTTTTNGAPASDTNQVLNASEDSGMATGGSNNSETDPTKITANKDALPVKEETTKFTNVISSQEEEKEAEPNKTNAAEADMIEPNSSDLIPTGNAMETEEEPTPNDKSIEVNTSAEVKMETDQEKLKVEENSNKTTEASNESVVTTSIEPQPTTEPNQESKQSTKQLRESTEPVRLLFTHMEPELTSQLQTCALKLGLSMASSPIDCTHLVVNRISRTPKFICAFSHASYILSHQWLLESFEVGQVLDEKQFILQDSKGEEQYSFNLVYSLLKRKKRSSLLFSNMVFFVTPSVLAKVKCLKEMIESAGGIVATRKLPTRAQIDLMRSDGRRLVAVSNQQDLYLCSSLMSLDVAIVGYEFIISGILRQDIDFDAHRLIHSPQQTSQSETSLTRLRSPKRVRLDSVHNR